MYKHNVEIIISRYNENLDWLNEYPFNQFEYIVYNKGTNNNFIKNNVKKIVELKNVGKCDHTYLFHIIHNYHHLSNIVVFLPGSLDISCKKDKAIHMLTAIIRSNFKRAYFIGHYQEDVCNSFKDFQLDVWGTTHSQNALINQESVLQKCKLRPYGVWYKYFFGNQKARWSTWWGIFSIDKRDILQHNVSRYMLLINTINNHSNPEAGHYIERSWGAIFYPLLHTYKIC